MLQTLTDITDEEYCRRVDICISKSHPEYLQFEETIKDILGSHPVQFRQVSDTIPGGSEDLPGTAE
ncbi:MAG: hypothetical protein ACLUUO_05635 [Sellimonas intestinalis]